MKMEDIPHSHLGQIISALNAVIYLCNEQKRRMIKILSKEVDIDEKLLAQIVKELDLEHE